MPRLARSLATAALLLAAGPTAPQPPQPRAEPAILLTIFLRHDQSRTLSEINAQLERNGWYARFPPQGIQVVSWYVMMGIGQVVTLRVPPDRVREVNLAVENGAWGAYRTEFYVTYDYRPVWEEQQAKQRR
jgi:hypothetical protein